MKRRNIPRILAKRLLREKLAAGSWRALHEQKYPNIPAGTLCRIATSEGEYTPRRLDFRETLGLGSLPCPTCNHRITHPKIIRTWRHVSDLKPEELLFVLEHREVMP